MKRKKQILRVVAVFLLLNFVTQLLLPTAVWALTAGPTAPEFSSFEPVDATDMVNLATGDLTYNIPLLEIPGPEGGYPLSLSYHAGIQPDEEASWVGLGWTLNPGAINRTVSGYPDDVVQNQSVYDYLNGGSQDSYSIGISTGVGGTGVNFGLTVSNDTYQGIGVSLDFGIKAGGPMSVGLGVSTDPYGGNPTLNAGINVGSTKVNSIGLSGGMSISTNFESIRMNSHIGIGYNDANNTYSLLGAGISSNSSNANTSFVGASINSVNNNAGKISTSNSGFTISFPIYDVWVNLGYNHTRYWSSEASLTTQYGSLYYPEITDASSQSFDSYSLNTSSDITAEASKSLGACFPAFDLYSVTAQGLGGTMQPYIFENLQLFKRSSSSVGYNISSNSNQINSNRQVNFRFNNDFSNSFKRNNSLQSIAANTDDNIRAALDVADQYSNPQNAGFIKEKNYLAGSRSIEWFTNQEIINKTPKSSKLILPNNFNHSNYFNNQSTTPITIGNQIGGFMITNESGVTYHYSLPVYSYNEYSKTTDAKDPLTYREENQGRPYAYTWLLVGITGPDYVDRGLKGLDDSDYGYWVSFDYGKWLGDYKWRNPATGFHKDIDSRNNFYSRGSKEIYYLDAIKTRTHIAIFEKELRDDGKEIADNENGELIKVIKLPDYYRYYYGPSADLNPYSIRSRSMLKLSNIYLFKKDILKSKLVDNGVSDFVNIKSKADGTKINYTNDYWAHYDDLGETIIVNNKDIISHNTQEVIDNYDIAAIPNFKESALRIVKLTSDNSTLCKNTYNSFAWKLGDKNIAPVKTGKLRLSKVEFLGKGGDATLPGISFNYSTVNPDYDKDKKDIWGNYSDIFNSTLSDINENLARTPTSESHPEAWSLININTPSGADINIAYEPDDYTRSAIDLKNHLTIESLTMPTDLYSGGTNYSIVINFKENLAQLPLIKEYFMKNSDFQLNIFGLGNTNGSSTGYTKDFKIGTDFTISDVDMSQNKITIVSENICKWHRDLEKLRTCGKATCIPSKLMGHIYFSLPYNYGGGLRVKEIAISSNGNISKTSYNYKGDNGYSSGQTSYIPLLEPKSILEHDDAKILKDKLVDFRFKLVDFYKLLSLGHEIPSPGVIYKKVSVQESFTDKNNVTTINSALKVYDFEVYDNNLDNLIESSTTTLANSTGFSASKHLFRNFTSRIGNLLKVTTYGQTYLTGSTVTVLSEVTNTYMHQLGGNTNSDYINTLSQNYFDQGRIDQLFYEYRNLGSNKQLVVSRKEEYPNILVSKEIYNRYNTALKEKTEYLAFDFYTGAPIKTKSTDAYGNTYISVSKPAYMYYPEMGVRMPNNSNKNMLTQNALTYTYQASSTNIETSVGLVSANFQEWSNNTSVLINNTRQTQPESIWRKAANFMWTPDVNTSTNSDGLIDFTAFGNELTYLNDNKKRSSSLNWQNQGSITLVDAYSHPLESVDINGKYSCNKYDVLNQKIIANGNNVAYDLFAYSGAEVPSNNTSENGVVFNGIWSQDFAHTGKSSIKVASGSNGYSYTLKANKYLPNTKYVAKVWVRPTEDTPSNLSQITLSANKGTTLLKSQSIIASNKSKSWYLVELIFETGTTNTDDITVVCKNNSAGTHAVYFDDFRLQPITSIVSAYVYDSQTGELAYILDNDNFYIKYEYDNQGRLVKSSRELFYYVDKTIQTQKYNNRK